MENNGIKKFIPDPKLKLMDQVRQVLRYHHYAYRTEQTYCEWILRYIKFHGSKTHPLNMGKIHIDAFLSHLNALWMRAQTHGMYSPPGPGPRFRKKPCI